MVNFSHFFMGFKWKNKVFFIEQPYIELSRGSRKSPFFFWVFFFAGGKQYPLIERCWGLEGGLSPSLTAFFDNIQSLDPIIKRSILFLYTYIYHPFRFVTGIQPHVTYIFFVRIMIFDRTLYFYSNPVRSYWERRGVVALHLPFRLVKNRSGLEPVPRCELNTYKPISRWLSHCAFGAGYDAK